MRPRLRAAGDASLAGRKLLAADQARQHLVWLGAALLLLLAGHLWVGRYEILLTHGSWVGYTDIRARLPGQTALAVLAVAVAAAVAWAGWKGRWVPAVAAVAALATSALLLEQLYPAAVEKLRVEPNQLASETPYIAWNLDLTRRAYGLDHLEREPYPYRAATRSTWDAARNTLHRLPRWDPEPLRTNFNQVENIFTYYRFPSVDLDRYGPAGAKREVAISSREFDPGGLPTATRTWQTLHLNPRYQQGWGAVVTAADEVTPQGEPVYWLENLRPIQRSQQAPEDVRLDAPGHLLLRAVAGVRHRGPRGQLLRRRAGRDYPSDSSLAPSVGSWPSPGASARRTCSFWARSTRAAGSSSAAPSTHGSSALARWIVWDRDPHPVIYAGHLCGSSTASRRRAPFLSRAQWTWRESAACAICGRR